MMRGRKTRGRMYAGALLLGIFQSVPEASAQPRVTERVSVGTGGGQLDGHSAGPVASANGRYIAFLSEATSLDGCIGTPGTLLWGSGLAHVYLRDRQAGTTECISRASDETPGNGRSEAGAVSSDGRFVVFTSRSSNFVTPATTTSRVHVYMRDRTNGTTQLVSVAPDGVTEADSDSESPKISDNGRFVVFVSRSTNLVAGGTTLNRAHVYIRDLTMETTALVSVATDGTTEGNGNSLSPSITPDASHVAFSSTATNLLAGADSNGAVSDIFVRDLTHGTTAVVSVANGGAQGNDGSGGPAISADGRIVVFGSSATNLVPGEDATAVLFVRDVPKAATTVIRLANTGAPAARFPFNASISGDGRMVAFLAQTSPGTIGGAPGHFVHDRSLGATVFVAVGSSGNSSSPLPMGPALTRNGRELLFDSVVTNLIAGDTNGRMDVFAASLTRYIVDPGVYRASTGTWLIARAFDGVTQTTGWGAPSLGDVPVFADYDGDGRADVAVYRRTSGEWFLAFSSGGSRVMGWGAPALHDVPVPADYDGDGKADVAVYRQTSGAWLIAFSNGGSRTASWGAPSLGDVPVPGDYDGDGRADVAVYRKSTGQWFIEKSSGGSFTAAWGSPTQGDVPVPGDYDGDGIVDMGVYRTSTGEWFVALSGGGVLHATFGSASNGDIAVPADYDADGRTDLAVYRHTTGDWFIFQSSSQSVKTLTLGSDAQGDMPITVIPNR